MIINPRGKDVMSVSCDFLGKKLTFEVNRVGFRSTASVLVTYGETVVLGTAMVGKKEVADLDYFPLSIDYEEKYYAAGKISGSRFVKREGRPSDEAVLIGRLIDRPIRPLFPKGYRREVQVVSTVLSMDPEFRPDVIAMIASSTALMLTGIPFDGPVAGLRVTEDGKSFKAFAKREEYDANKLDIVVAGIESGITMVEAGAKEVSEKTIIDAIAWAHEAMQPAIELQKKLVKKVGVKKLDYTLVLPDEEVLEEVKAWTDGKLGKALRAPYPRHNELVEELREEFHKEMEAKYEEAYEEKRADFDEAFTKLIHNDVREGIIN